jgi:hypothetical protein
MADDLDRYKALLQTQSDERVRKTLRDMIREIEQRIAAERDPSASRDGDDR